MSIDRNFTINNIKSRPILETALTQVSNLILIVEGSELRISYVNDSLLNLWGQGKSIIGKDLLQIFPWLKDHSIYHNLLKVLESGKSMADPRVVIPVDGSGITTYIDYTLTPIINELGQVTGATFIGKDLSHPAGSGSVDSDVMQPLDMALSAGELGYYEVDLQTGAVQCNDRFRTIFGFAADSPVTQEDIYRLIQPQYHKYLETLFAESIHNRGAYNTRYEISLPDGSVRWIMGTGTARFDEHQAPVTLIGMVRDISPVARQEAEQSILKSIVENSDDAILSKTLEGYITSWNKAAEKMFGYQAREVIGKHITILIPTDRLSEEDHIINQIKKGEKIDHYETIRKTKDGRLIPISLTVSPIRDSRGKITGASKIARDLSVNKQAEEKQAMLASIVDNSHDAIISKTLTGIITSWNQAAERLYGYTAEEAIGQHISILIPADRLNEESYVLSSIKKGEGVDHFETQRRTKAGKLIPVSLSVSPIRDSKGNITGASKIARDITESKDAEVKQAMLAAIVNSSDDAIISKTLKGFITSWNSAAEKLFGYTAEEAVGKHISMLIPTNLLDEEEHIIGNIAKGRKVDHFETIRMTKSGQMIPISITVSPIQDSKGNIIGASKIARNISDKKESEEALERYTRNLEIINSMAKSISENLDIVQILQKVANATRDLIGARYGAFFYKTADEDGSPNMLYAFSGDLAGQDQHSQVTLTNPAFNSTSVFRLDDIGNTRVEETFTDFGRPRGELEVVSYLEVPMFSKTGTVSGYLVFGHPEASKFTQEHENLIVGISLQASIALENARLFEEVTTLNAKKDEFIGLASHELKTPLTSMSGYLQILERKQHDEMSRNFVHKTIEKAGKLTALVSDLLDISKIQAGKLQFNLEMFDIRKVVNDAIEVIQLSTPSHQIELITEVESYLVQGDKQRIEQVVVNLLTNAVKYSPSAKKVEIYLYREEAGIRLGVKDFGIGISSENQAKIFSRFYRVNGLSPHMSGLGIGLYITREIVERHHGRIWVESVPGAGSTFWFTLPGQVN